MRMFIVGGVVAAAISFLATSASAGPSCEQADFNADGIVDEADVAILRSSLGKAAGDPGYVAAADLDGSGNVTVADFGLLLTCN